MGTVGPLEAEFTLRGPIAAGSWRLVADGIILEPVDMRFELLWRSSAGDQVIATFDHHFDPPPNGFDAVAYEDTREADTVPATAGDQLIFRYQALNATRPVAYVPNGDGESHNGRIPFIELP